MLSSDPTRDHTPEELTCDSLISFLLPHVSLFIHPPGDHVVSFLLNDHFEERLPSEWASFLLSCSTETLLEMALDGVVPEFGDETPVPSSLAFFVSEAFRLRHSSFWSLRDQHSESESVSEEAREEDARLKTLYVGMKPKKRHEVDRLADVVALTCRSVGVKSIVNIGCGRNYLSQVLTFRYGFSVCGVDCSRHVLERSIMKAEDTEIRTGRKNRFAAVQSHLSCETTVDEFAELVGPALLSVESEDVESDGESDGGVLLLGLHTCGKLGITLLDLFLRFQSSTDHWRPVVAAMNIPCCWHKLRESSGDFPLSQFVRDRWSCGFSSAAFNLASQALDKWRVANVREDGTYHCTAARLHCQRHSYRCALEVFLDQWFVKEDDLRPFVIGRIGKNMQSFGNYCYAAVQKIRKDQRYSLREGVTLTLRPKRTFIEERNRFYESLKPNSHGIIKKIEAYWIIRAMLGPLLENLILLDRILHLREGGVQSHLVKAFDASVSPRNRMIVAFAESIGHHWSLRFANSSRE